MANSKADIVAELKSRGVEFDPKAPVSTLQPLLDAHLPDDHALKGASVKDDPKPKVDAERQARWEVFCAKVRVQNPTQYDERAAKGEFDAPPESWVA